MSRTIQIADEEAEILKSVLEEYISELRMEVANTDSIKVAILKRLAGQLTAGRSS